MNWFVFVKGLPIYCEKEIEALQTIDMNYRPIIVNVEKHPSRIIGY